MSNSRDYPGDDPSLTYNKNKDYRNERNQVNKNYIRRPQYNKKIYNQNYHRKTVVNSVKNNLNLRERLIEELNNECCDCPICCSGITRNSRIWSCLNCFNVYHMKCIREWARSSLREEVWDCPSCKSRKTIIPNNYMCFCGKMKDPPMNDYSITAHSCGEVCGRVRQCSHKCVALCHPGKCPSCVINITTACYCGRVSKVEICQITGFSCQTNKCGRLLDCGVHFCSRICHPGECGGCEEEMDLDCFCGRETQRIKCCEKTKQFSCYGICRRKLACGVHECGEVCHVGDCAVCPFHIENLSTCSCGKTPISEIFEEKVGVLASLPTCDKICGRTLLCGLEDISKASHTCPLKCHVGDCPNYCSNNTSLVYCVCKKTKNIITCREVNDSLKNIKCNILCNIRKACKRHTCKQVCCPLVLHYCSKTCERPLNCKNHNCEETCHSGKCKPCSQFNHEELSCHCGRTVICPPTRCGTLPPICPHPCDRIQECIHPVNHDCHLTGQCPPCSTRITAECYGGHKKLDSVLCYLQSFSCGDKCNKSLSCGHKCILTCHRGPCGACNQLCNTRRTECSHTCAAHCSGHIECCVEPCGKMVDVYCECKCRLEKMICGEAKSELECNDFCVKQRRVKGIVNLFGVSDINAVYAFTSVFIQTAKQNIKFIKYVERTLCELITSLNLSDQNVYDFPIMNFDKCSIIEKMAEYYGCESTIYDSEPYMNITVFAYKGKSSVPHNLLSTVCLNNQ